MSGDKNKMKCGGCLKNIESRMSLQCSLCEKFFDLKCANVSEQRFLNTMSTEHKAAWKCSLCRNKQYKHHTNTVNERRGAAASNSDLLLNSSPETESTNADFKALITEVRLFREEMRATRGQLELLNGTISQLVTRVDICERRIDELCTRMDSQEKCVKDQEYTTHPNSSLISIIARLKTDLNARDQDLLQNDIEISGIPETKGENILHTVMTLGGKLDVNLMEQDVVSAERIGRAPGRAGVHDSDRPRLIVVRLARRATRDKLLQAARVRRGATTQGLDLPGPHQRFYLNERLTKTNRYLFRQARLLGQRLKWRFVWTKEGRIYARQSQEASSPRLRIYTEADLGRVFGENNVGRDSEYDIAK